ncbi:MAG: exodeoxyribonuclease VII large subunit [Clostridium sp.]
MKIKVLSVSEVNSYIKKIIDNDFILNNLSVKGEISNLKYHSSGHIYFSLKDDFGKINCVMFKSDAYNLELTLKEGMNVTIKARASIYSVNGSLQLYCTKIEDTGLGELYIKFERLKEKLKNEGMFDSKYKKKLPSNPSKIGVVTALTGAAIHDIINVTNRRNKGVDIVLYPAKVQGKDGYKTIIDGINYFNKNKSVDLIIVGRGGGSMEELWNFNEEDLARAIFNSEIPIISAVGHEVDYTISDFVADLRAATPSQAAEIAVFDAEYLKDKLINIKTLLNKTMNSIIVRKRINLDSIKNILDLNSPKLKIMNEYTKIDILEDRLNLAAQNILNLEKSKLSSKNKLLLANNPLSILNKGYAVIRKEDKPIISKSQLSKAETIEIIFKDGRVKGDFVPEN